MADSPAVKALREIRTRITQRVPERNTVVMVTGLHRGSGISFVAVNLATAIVLDEARTALLVDCNLRDTSLHSLLPDQRPVGLTDYLLGGEDDVSDIIHPTGVERVRVIPVGSRINPAVEYFSMEKMRRLVRSISERYADRHIILDCPPLARTADTQLLMELCDYVLLVLPHGGVTTDLLFVEAGLEERLSARLGRPRQRRCRGQDSEGWTVPRWRPTGSSWFTPPHD